MVGPALDLLPAKEVLLGESTHVRRLLPTLGRRMVGAWAFVDHYGPDDVATSAGMQVAPHPHTGLQTVSWLLDGEVHHRDSLAEDDRFGAVVGYDGERLEAPPLPPVALRPRGRVR